MSNQQYGGAVNTNDIVVPGNREGRAEGEGATSKGT